MHRHVVKPGKKSLANEFSLVGSSLEASKQFNVNTLTTLKEENQDNKRLKDCKISPKFLKSLKKSSSSSGDTNVNRVKASKLNGTDKKGNANQDEVQSRQTLGFCIMNAVDVYLKKMQRQYVKYLVHMRSSVYEAEVKQRLKDEEERAKDLSVRKEKVC